MKQGIHYGFIFCFFACLLNTVSASDVSPKIIGGQNDSISNFPHSAFLLINRGGACGASIIRDRILLTAAHCLLKSKTNKMASRVQARIGSDNLYYSPQKIMAEKWIIHENYTAKRNHDLALVYLNESIEFGYNVKKVLLDLDDIPQPGTVHYVAGWGGNLPKSVLDRPLMSLRQIVLKRAECKEIYTAMPKSRICAWSGSMGPKPYFGDSGSALVHDTFKQVGLVSGGRPNSRGIIFYTALWPYKKWLLENIELLEKSC